MAVKRVFKEALINENTLFVVGDNEFESISPSFAYNLIDIISLDGLGGNAVTPTAGNYKVYAKTDAGGGFKLISSPSNINANLTGGSSLPDGLAGGLSFIGLALEIKIVPSDIDVAVAYRVFIKQSSSQLNSNDSVGKVEIQNTSITAFDEKRTAQDTAITQISASHGLIGQVLTVVDTAVSGTTTVTDDKFTCQTGTGATGLATILSLRQVGSRPGQGVAVRFDALFSPGVALSQQSAGLITNENSYVFIFVGTTFGIVHAHGGISENQDLTITTPASGSETATITINGVAFPVPITTGNAEHNAFEIANTLNTLVSNYIFTSNDNQVVAQSLLSGTQGAFAFSSATAAAAWFQEHAGVSADVTFIPQTEWSEDTRINSNPSINLDPLAGNGYQIQLGSSFGQVRFSIEDKDTGSLILVHRLKLANTSTSPNVTNPIFRIGWVAQNFGNTTNVTMQGSACGAFIEGDTRRHNAPRTVRNNQLSVGTTPQTIIVIRNRIHFGGKVNRVEIFLNILSASSQANKATFFQFLLNPTFLGDLDFSYLDKDSSIIEFATDAVGISGGLDIGGFIVPSNDGDTLTLNQTPDQDTIIFPGAVLAIVGFAAGGAGGDMQASITMQEDFV